MKLDWDAPKDTFAQMHFLEVPNAFQEDDEMYSRVAKMIKGVSITFSEHSDALEMNIDIAAASEKRAEQFKQLAQGARAGVTLFKDQIADEINEEEAAEVMNLIEEISIEKKGKSVEIQLEIPTKWILKFLREEADLAL